MTVAPDASRRGIGAVLYQPVKPADPPAADTLISMTSRSLLPHERNYPSYKLEMLGIVNALVAWEHWLPGTHFTILTEHLALAFLLTQASVSRVMGNWLSLLLEFRLEIIHLPG